MLLCLALAILPLVGLAGGAYVDPDNGITFFGSTEAAHGVTYGYVFPPFVQTGSNSTEFIGEIVAPIAAQWAGVSPGGAMLNNLLLVAWPNAEKFVRSSRYTTQVLLPSFNGGWIGPDITWDPNAPVDEAGGYDKAVRAAAQLDMNEFARRMESLTMAEENLDANIDRPWRDAE
ncbi:hypothetical protein BDZ97DRAFT_1765737 [Flammula alnicola]|nr:hypothetical protein BDZ97DRAFT_1765737 [Flammula alnicola]